MIPLNYSAPPVVTGREGALDECAHVFKESLMRRIRKLEERGYELTCDLSGGMDTRAVFAGLCNANVQFTPCHDKLISGDESAVASEVAAGFEKTLSEFSAEHPVDDMEALSEVVFQTGCNVHGWTATSCHYDDRNRCEHTSGRVANFMGFGGEWIRSPYRPRFGYGKGIQAALNDAFTNFIPVHTACQIMNVSLEEFRISLEERFGEIADNERALARAFYFEFYRKLVGAGEENTRRFFWTVTPLLGLEFISLVWDRIDSRLADFRFFVDFLARIDRRASQYPIHGSGLSPNSRLSLFTLNARSNLLDLIRRTLPLRSMARRARSLLGVAPDVYSESSRRWAVSQIESILKTNARVAKQISPNASDLFLKKPFIEKTFSTPQIYQALTLIVFVKRVVERFDSKFR